MALHTKVDGDGLDGRYLSVSPLLDGKVTVPKHRLPDGPMLPEMAHELMLDGNARLNLATFVTTWMEPQAEKLMADAFDRNMIDKDEYPQTAELEMRCVNMLSRLWNSPSTDMFLDDLKRFLVRLEKQSSPTHDESDAGFAH